MALALRDISNVPRVPSACAAPSRPPSAPPPPPPCEYAEDIIAHLREREQATTRDTSYLRRQPDLSERMRCIVVDWMVDVAIKFSLHPETFFLAVEVLDAYLAQRATSRKELQLIGIGAILIAAKHEEIYPPDVRECVTICADTYPAADVLRIERVMATTLHFRLTLPTPYHFLTHILTTTRACELNRHLSMMFLEAAAIDVAFVAYLPSTVAAAATLAARYVIDDGRMEGVSSPLLIAATQCPVETLVPVANQVLGAARALLAPTTRYVALKRKYTLPAMSSVALLTLPHDMPPSW